MSLVPQDREEALGEDQGIEPGAVMPGAIAGAS